MNNHPARPLRRGPPLNNRPASAGPTQPTGQAKKIVRTDIQGQTQGPEFGYAHFLGPLFVADVLPSGAAGPLCGPPPSPLLGKSIPI